jgi:hypothetical protein
MYILIVFTISQVTAYNFWIHRHFPCAHNAANLWYDVRFICFGRKLNMAGSKNSFLTVTRIQTNYVLIVLIFRISKDIVWAHDFKPIVYFNTCNCDEPYRNKCSLNW